MVSCTETNAAAFMLNLYRLMESDKRNESEHGAIVRPDISPTWHFVKVKHDNDSQPAWPFFALWKAWLSHSLCVAQEIREAFTASRAKQQQQALPVHSRLRAAQLKGPSALQPVKGARLAGKTAPHHNSAGAAMLLRMVSVTVTAAVILAVTLLLSKFVAALCASSPDLHVPGSF